MYRMSMLIVYWRRRRQWWWWYVMVMVMTGMMMTIMHCTVVCVCLRRVLLIKCHMSNARFKNIRNNSYVLLSIYIEPFPPFEIIWASIPATSMQPRSWNWAIWMVSSLPPRRRINRAESRVYFFNIVQRGTYFAEVTQEELSFDNMNVYIYTYM